MQDTWASPLWLHHMGLGKGRKLAFNLSRTRLCASFNAFSLSETRKKAMWVSG